MNNKRIGKMAVTAIIGIISAISAVAVTELTKGIKKDVERTEKERKGDPRMTTYITNINSGKGNIKKIVTAAKEVIKYDA